MICRVSLSRTCNKCKVRKLKTDFHKTYPKPPYCKECVRKQNNASYAKHSKKVLEQRRLTRTGWTQRAFDAAWLAQDGKCAICSNPLTKTACADHNHVTGKPRGIICPACNLMLGKAKDNADVLEAGATYLRSHV